MDWENFKTLIHTGQPHLLCSNNWKNILKRNKLTKKIYFSIIQDTPNAVQRTQSLPSLSLLPPLWKPILIKENKSWLTKKGTEL